MKHGATGYRSGCRCEACKTYSRDTKWEYNLRTKYGMTLDEYNKLLDQQDGVCAICGATPSDRRLCVDHCHDEGTVRGLLCAQCNSALGYFRDDARLTARAVCYLLDTPRPIPVGDGEK